MAHDTPDELLVEHTLAGDTGAFAVLVARHRRRALAKALAVLGDHGDADDVAQEAFVHAYEQLATCRHPARFLAWLMVIVHRRALNHLRQQRRRPTTPLDTALASTSPEQPLAMLQRQDLRRMLLAALEQLTPVQREVVLLADLEDWSHVQIAESMGLSVLMSRRHLSDARRRLRTLLASWERNHD